MSRGYRIRHRIRVTERIEREVSASDEICSQLEVLEVLPREQMADLLSRELQERVSTYEKRTAELEKELVAKAEQTRQLMNATILLTQEKVAQKKAAEPFTCN